MELNFVPSTECWHAAHEIWATEYQNDLEFTGYNRYAPVQCTTRLFCTNSVSFQSAIHNGHCYDYSGRDVEWQKQHLEANFTVYQYKLSKKIGTLRKVQDFYLTLSHQLGMAQHVCLCHFTRSDVTSAFILLLRILSGLSLPTSDLSAICVLLLVSIHNYL